MQACGSMCPWCTGGVVKSCSIMTSASLKPSSMSPFCQMMCDIALGSVGTGSGTPSYIETSSWMRTASGFIASRGSKMAGSSSYSTSTASAAASA